MKKRLIWLLLASILLCMTGCVETNEPVTLPQEEPTVTVETVPQPSTVIEKHEEVFAVPEKPVIYLYPEEETMVSVKLDFNGTLTSTYPAYENGWQVLAQPDGMLTDPVTGRQYYCLFWEGESNVAYDLSRGFVVAGADTENFLEEALAQLGLTDTEANEFIIYWLPRMEGNAYNLISFQQALYTDNAVLNIEPAPDSVLRVFMAWQALEQPVQVEPQTLEPFERTGFTVVEWGGAEIKD